jgi:hypothetical protein
MQGISELALERFSGPIKRDLFDAQRGARQGLL